MNTGQDIDRTRITDLTIEEVRACPTFARLNDNQANEVLETLKLFTKIAYDLSKNLRKITIRKVIMCILFVDNKHKNIQ